MASIQVIWLLVVLLVMSWVLFSLLFIAVFHDMRELVKALERERKFGRSGNASGAYSVAAGLNADVLSGMKDTLR